MSKKVLILHTSVGLGHKYIAVNIGHHLVANGFEVRVEDLMQVQSVKFQSLTTGIYLWLINKLPGLWKWLYLSKLWSQISLPFRTIVASRNYALIKRLIDEYNPDIVITTQTAASAVVAYLKQQGMYQKIFGIAFSDFHLHPYWIYKEADLYLANIPEQKAEMVKQGIAAEKILVNGIALNPIPPMSKEQAKQTLGITTEKVIFFTAGSLGFGISKKYIADSLADLKQRVDNFTLVVICGKDKKIYEELSTLHDPSLLILGFYTPADHLYIAADVFVGKPGGLMASEALYYRLPIIVTHWMPGGEGLNIAYLTKDRLVMPVNQKDRHQEILREIVQELKTGNFKSELFNQNPLINQLANTDPKRIGEFMSKLV